MDVIIYQPLHVHVHYIITHVKYVIIIISLRYNGRKTLTDRLRGQAPDLFVVNLVNKTRRAGWTHAAAALMVVLANTGTA